MRYRVCVRLPSRCCFCLPYFSMKTSVQITRGIESLFGTRDENIRLLESGLGVQTRLVDGNSLELEGEEPQVKRAENIL